MSLGIDLIASNLDMSLEIIVCILAWLGGIIFYAKDFRLGTFVHILFFGGLLVWFYEQSMMWQLPLIVMILHTIFLSFSLYATYKSSLRGGVI